MLNSVDESSTVRPPGIGPTARPLFSSFCRIPISESRTQECWLAADLEIGDTAPKAFGGNLRYIFRSCVLPSRGQDVGTIREHERPSMNLSKHPLVAILLLFSAAGVVTSFGAAEEASAVYLGLKPDEFMLRWLMLRHVSVPEQSEETKKAFAVDYLKSVGGETNDQPTAGETVDLDGSAHRWR